MEAAVPLVNCVATAFLLCFWIWRSIRARAQARWRGPVKGFVEEVVREQRLRKQPSFWVVTTRFWVPDHGALLHRRRFAYEEQAIRWQDDHPDGSEHEVFPNERDLGEAFVAEDVRRLILWPCMLAIWVLAAAGLLAGYLLVEAVSSA